MTLQLGDVAPDFTQESSAGPILFHAWLGTSWGVLFSHPRDFTPVCTTELAEAARLKPEFERRNVKLLGLSVDSVAAHRGWFDDIAQTQGHALNFPVLADADRTVASLYGMIHPNADPALTVRAVYVIAPDKRVRLVLSYPPNTGRNFAEILRAIDSLQLTDRHKVATPADWQQGGDVIIVPSLDDSEAAALFPDGWTTHKPYLRTVPQPAAAE